MTIFPANFTKTGWVFRATCTGLLTLALGAFTLAQQAQSDNQEPPIQSRDLVPQQSQPQAQPPKQQANRPLTGQSARQPEQQAGPPLQQDTIQPPVTSEDRLPQNSPQYSQRNSGQYPSRYRRQEQSGPPPSQLTIPAGTVLLMRLNEPLSSDHNLIGDQFTGVLEQPIVVSGWVVARRGETVAGQVKSVKRAGRIKGVSQLGLELTDVTLVDGQQAPILTELWQASGGTTHGADAATIGGGTALGAIIGSAADWGRGAAIGAGAGAAAGIGAVLLTRGRPTILEPESRLTFRLEDPVSVDTTHSQQAFLPVTQEDYGNRRGYRPGLRIGNGYYGYPGYAPVPCGYGYYAPCYYPGYVGIDPEFGWWGGGFYGGAVYRRGFYGRRGFRRW